MKNIILTAVALISILGLTGCPGKKDSGVTYRGGREQRGAQSNTFTNANGTTQTPYARIQFIGKVSSSTDAEFQTQVKNFSAASVPKESLGYVSPSNNMNDNSGLFFGGIVRFANSNISQAYNQNMRAEISGNSELLVGVWDQYVGSRDVSGNTINPVSIYLSQSAGYVQGSHAHLEFRDAFGLVVLDGQYDDQVFQGTFSYDNQKNWDGSAGGHAGTIGAFAVPTCQIFVCN